LNKALENSLNIRFWNGTAATLTIHHNFWTFKSIKFSCLVFIWELISRTSHSFRLPIRFILAIK